MFQAAKDRFVTKFTESFEKAIVQFWIDLKYSLDNAVNLFQKGIKTADEGLQFLFKQIVGVSLWSKGEKQNLQL